MWWSDVTVVYLYLVTDKQRPCDLTWTSLSKSWAGNTDQLFTGPPLFPVGEFGWLGYSVQRKIVVEGSALVYGA